MNSNQQVPDNQPPVYPGAPAATRRASGPAKPWFKRWWVWVGAVVILVGMANALGGGSKEPSPATPATQQTASSTSVTPAAPAPKKEKLTLDEGWAMDKTQFAVYVNGYVTNNTDKAVTNYVQITFDALDKQGANLGTCLANTNTVDANGKWKFKAICTGEAKEVATVRFKEITGF